MEFAGSNGTANVWDLVVSKSLTAIELKNLKVWFEVDFNVNSTKISLDLLGDISLKIISIFITISRQNLK